MGEVSSPTPGCPCEGEGRMGAAAKWSEAGQDGSDIGLNVGLFTGVLFGCGGRVCRVVLLSFCCGFSNWCNFFGRGCV